MFSKAISTAVLAASASLINGLPTATTNITMDLDTRTVATKTFNSVLTWYDPATGACGQTNGPNDPIVGVDPKTYGEWPSPNLAPVCGKKMRVQYGGRTADLSVADKCVGCPLYGLDLPPGTRESLVGPTGLPPQQGTWDWI